MLLPELSKNLNEKERHLTPCHAHVACQQPRGYNQLPAANLRMIAENITVIEVAQETMFMQS